MTTPRKATAAKKATPKEQMVPASKIIQALIDTVSSEWEIEEICRGLNLPVENKTVTVTATLTLTTAGALALMTNKDEFDVQADTVLSGGSCGDWHNWIDMVDAVEVAIV